jgi:hypothetical protein
MPEYTIQPRGDTRVVVRDHVFVVSSEVLSSLSPEFEKYLRDAGDAPALELHGENPQVFYRLFQSAHSVFVPQSDVSLPVLKELAVAMWRYSIPSGSKVHKLVQFCFIVPPTVQNPIGKYPRLSGHRQSFGN